MNQDEFADEFSDLAYEAGITDVCKLEFPAYMAERNRRDPRSFAEVDPWDLHFCFAPQILDLPDPQRRGIMMHELGHVLCRHLPGGGTEHDADLAAERCFGVAIEYDCRWPGKGLQVVRQNPVSLRNPRYLKGIHKIDRGGSSEYGPNVKRKLHDVVVYDTIEVDSRVGDIVFGYCAEARVKIKGLWTTVKLKCVEFESDHGGRRVLAEGWTVRY